VLAVGIDHRREKKADKVLQREGKVPKFDGKFLNNSIFDRRSLQKDSVGMVSHEEELVDVFAIEKGAPIDWLRGRKDRYIISDINLEISAPDGAGDEIMVKEEPGIQGSSGIEDDDVQYIGSSASALRGEGATSSIKKAIEKNMAAEVSLSRQKEADAYCNSLSPTDLADILTWDANERTAPELTQMKEPFAFSTPTKRGPIHSRPLSPVARKKIQLPSPDRPGVAITRTVPTNFRGSQASQAPILNGSSSAEKASQQEWVRPVTLEELYALKRKQMQQKTKWAVNNALKNSKSV
jgi:hypothetical protein